MIYPTATTFGWRSDVCATGISCTNAPPHFEQRNRSVFSNVGRTKQASCLATINARDCVALRLLAVAAQDAERADLRAVKVRNNCAEHPGSHRVLATF